MKRRTHTKQTQDRLSLEIAIEILKKGNKRLINNIKAHRNLFQQANESYNIGFGNITSLLNKIKPAFDNEIVMSSVRNGSNESFIIKVTTITDFLKI